MIGDVEVLHLLVELLLDGTKLLRAERIEAHFFGVSKVSYKWQVPCEVKSKGDIKGG